MSIHLVIGRQGSGKTLLLVKVAYEAYKIGKTVYSNIKLFFPFQKINRQDIIDCKLENGIVIIDEVHIFLPARNSTSKENREIVDGFMSMARKKNLEVYGTTQMEEKVDRRFRLEKDYLYMATKYKKVNGFWQEVLSSLSFSKTEPIIIKLQIIEMFSYIMIEKCFVANSYYDLYDTKEIVKIT